MWKKALFLALVLAVGFGIGYYGITEAHHHHGPRPGIDKPYDPPKYYSQTEISWADSPSEFALKDLAAQGGNVYDYTRHLKSILYGTKFQAWLQNLLQQVGISKKNTEFWPEMSADETIRILEEIQKKQNDHSILPDVEDNSHMLNAENITDEELDPGDYSLEKKYRYLHNSYLGIATDNQESMKNLKNIMDATAYATELSDEAAGDVQQQQTKNYLDAVRLSAYNEFGNGLNRLTTLRALQQQKEDDETAWESLVHEATVTTPLATYNNERTYEDAERWSGLKRTKVKTPDF